MSKDHSEGDTKFTPNKYGGEHLSVEEQTRRAVRYYSLKRKEFLLAVKKEFVLKREQIRQGARESQGEEQGRSKRKKKKRKKEPTGRKIGEKSMLRKNILKRVNYRQRSSSSEKVQRSQSDLKKYKVRTESSKQKHKSQQVLAPEGTYQLKIVHESILEFQKTIDSYLDYQYLHRKKRAILLQQLFTFLKTTKYGLNGKRYFRYLNVYNSQLYFVEDEIIYCRDFHGKNVQERFSDTRRRMTQIQIAQLLI